MKELIDALLTVSRIDSRGEAFDQVDLSRTLENVLSNLSVLVNETGARVVQTRLPIVRGDARQLEQLLQTLIANSLKFRKGLHAPEVRVSAVEDAAGWKIAVEDDGIGFDSKHAERIFQMFQRLHERTTYPGNGIGLAVAKRIVRRHGGKIWATATPGGGATFSFTLPANDNAAAADARKAC